MHAQLGELRLVLGQRDCVLLNSSARVAYMGAKMVHTQPRVGYFKCLGSRPTYGDRRATVLLCFVDLGLEVRHLR